MSGHGDAWAAQTGRTAILIAVPELTEFTDRWRSVSFSSYRPTAALTELVPPHVTVLVPWLREPKPEDVQRLEDAVADLEPFELTFSTAGQFPNGTAWLRPEPFDQVRDLIATVLAAFPECPPYGGEFPDPHPHLTIASSAQGSPALVAEAQAALAAEKIPSILLDDLTIWREGDDGVWQLTGAVAIGGDPELR
ncbi:2'-5' RNA ligase family protein [Kribbella sp. NPDC023855]|uniref:2'-5' RNA ligase family protein n=1 Tax=Kribbella sp. NPDC023855 TaxID=3154698 RepID=UPI00340E99CF